MKIKRRMDKITFFDTHSDLTHKIFNSMFVDRMEWIIIIPSIHISYIVCGSDWMDYYNPLNTYIIYCLWIV